MLAPIEICSPLESLHFRGNPEIGWSTCSALRIPKEKERKTEQKDKSPPGLRPATLAFMTKDSANFWTLRNRDPFLLLACLTRERKISGPGFDPKSLALWPQTYLVNDRFWQPCGFFSRSGSFKKANSWQATAAAATDGGKIAPGKKSEKRKLYSSPNWCDSNLAQKTDVSSTQNSRKQTNRKLILRPKRCSPDRPTDMW